MLAGDEAAAETHPLTVVSSIHGTRPPSSTNLLRRIWKCTGGPPNDVNPKSQKLTATSRSRGSSLLVLAWYAPGRSSPALRRKLKMAESGIIAERYGWWVSQYITITGGVRGRGENRELVG